MAKPMNKIWWDKSKLWSLSNPTRCGSRVLGLDIAIARGELKKNVLTPSDLEPLTEMRFQLIGCHPTFQWWWCELAANRRSQPYQLQPRMCNCLWYTRVSIMCATKLIPVMICQTHIHTLQLYCFSSKARSGGEAPNSSMSMRWSPCNSSRWPRLWEWLLCDSRTR